MQAKESEEMCDSQGIIEFIAISGAWGIVFKTLNGKQHEKVTKVATIITC